MRYQHTICLNEEEEKQLVELRKEYSIMDLFRHGLMNPPFEVKQSVSTYSKSPRPQKFGASDIAKKHEDIVTATDSYYGCGCRKEEGITLCKKHGRI